MKLDFNREELLKLMKDFYLLSGIRMVLFDDEYRELLAYPEKPCAFCARMKSDERTRELCAASDRLSFRRAGSEKKLMIYHCHAGLIEATMPLVDGHVIIGYLMFGQISGDGHSRILEWRLTRKLAEYDIAADFGCAVGIPLKSDEEIHAAAKIMEACTLYALLNQTISLRRRHFAERLRDYISEHIGEPLDSQKVADAMGISRTRMYQQCQQYLGMGIAEYVKKLRIEYGQRLLADTELPVSEIAYRTGFNDYNYFCRVFKAETGMSPRKYREQHDE